ncbi:MAG: mannitol dehydrogenase family protein [Cognatishimia activa]
MTDTQFFTTAYDRKSCDIGIVHIGYGAFHRAHQAVYVDDYMQATGDLRWGIAAVNLRASESPSFAEAAGAERGYLLKSIAADGTQEFRSIRSHIAFVDAATDLDAALDLLSRPSVHVASMTVTESGYYFKDDWSLDLTAGPVADELNGGGLATIYGFLTQALERRAQSINAPISLLCCDNIRNNGKVLKNALLAYMEAAGKPDLAAWVLENASFPCSMVDRITPRSTPELKSEVVQLFPDHATAPIHAEDFSQWVLQDQFAGPMPDLARVGVEVVQTVEPYEEAKIRILNGGHTALCYLGALAGHDTFDHAMADPELRQHFDRYEREEVLAGLGHDIPFDTSAYLSQVAARFENAGIADQLERICMDGYSKMAIYIRPTLRACLEQGKRPLAGYDCAASWIVYARQFQAGKAQVPYHEPLWDKLSPILPKDREADLVCDPNLWGDLPTTYETFVPDLTAAIQEMEKRWLV